RRALTLEWQVSSPPPVSNFDEIPQVVGSPYEYGVRGARHAVLNGDRAVVRPRCADGGADRGPCGGAGRGEGGPPLMEEPRHILVVANETVAGKSLIDALRSRAEEGPIRAPVISPQNEPRAGFVVYADSRRSSADRRLRRTLDLLHEAGIAARGAVVDPDPLQAIKAAIYEYDPDEIIISTHPGELKSSWLRANLIERARKVTDKPVDHVVVDLESARERAHVLVLATQTVLGQPLLDAIHERSAAS